jgi:hypothetical protein
MQEENNQLVIPSFIVEVRDGYAKMPLRYANLIIGNKQNLHRLVSDEGWYLPKKDSRCCTSKLFNLYRYLFDVMGGWVFRIQQSQVKFCLNEKKRWSKIDIVAFIETRLLNNITLGFTIENLPNRDWLINVLFTLDSNHEVFTGTGEIEKLVEIPMKLFFSYRFLEKLNFLDSEGNKNFSGLIKNNKQERAMIETMKKEKKIVKKQRRKEYLTQSLRKIEEGLQELYIS